MVVKGKQVLSISLIDKDTRLPFKAFHIWVGSWQQQRTEVSITAFYRIEVKLNYKFMNENLIRWLETKDSWLYDPKVIRYHKRQPSESFAK